MQCFWWGKKKETCQLQAMLIDWKIILKWTVKVWCRMAGIRLICLSTGTIGNSSEHGNEPYDCIKLRESCG
jgi:hypothetical protein